MFHPTLAVDGNSRLGIMYYETTDATDTYIQPVFRGHIAPRSGSPYDEWQPAIVPLTVPFIPPPPAPSHGQPLGDYQSMAPTSPAIAPKCSGDGVFWPVWAILEPPAGPYAGSIHLQTRSASFP